MSTKRCAMWDLLGRGGPSALMISGRAPKQSRDVCRGERRESRNEVSASQRDSVDRTRGCSSFAPISRDVGLLIPYIIGFLGSDFIALVSQCGELRVVHERIIHYPTKRHQPNKWLLGSFRRPGGPGDSQRFTAASSIRTIRRNLYVRNHDLRKLRRRDH